MRDPAERKPPAARDESAPHARASIPPPRPDNSPLPADLARFLPEAQSVEALERPGSSRAVLYLMALFCLAALAWACLASVDTVVVAQGRLVTRQGQIVVQPLETAVIREVRAVPGQRVARGEVLVVLDPTFAQAGAEEVGKRLESLKAQIWRLTCEAGQGCPAPSGLDPAEAAAQLALREGRRKEFVQRREALERSVKELEARQATNKALTEGARKQIAIAQGVEAMYRDVFEKGASSRLEYMKAESARVEAESALRKLVSEAAEIAQALERSRAELGAFVSGFAAQAARELAEVRREAAGLEEKGRAVERRRELVELKSPAEAVVLEVARRGEGAVAEAAQPLVTLSPVGQPLEAEVEIAAADIGFVRQGDPARLKVEAFPFQRHGMLEAVVATVSADSFEAPQTALTGQTGQKAFAFRARLTLASADLKALPQGAAPLPGMTVTAEIRTGSRRVIAFLTDPLTRKAQEALRER